MAKVTAPLLSFGAAGQIGKSQVYSRWKGRSYARRHTIPANPQSAEQTKTRDSFTWLQQVYKLMPALSSAPWELFAKGKVLTGRNAFSQANLSTLRPASVVTDLVFSPGALGGPPPTALGPVGGSGTITTSVTAPSTVPVGWTITSAIVGAIRQQDSHGGLLYQMYAGEDLTSTYSIVLSGLAAGTYVVGAWLKWLRPDGLVAYSPSISSTVVVT